MSHIILSNPFRYRESFRFCFFFPRPFDSPKSNINSSFSINRPSIRITEYFDYPDDIEMQSANFSDAYETMT